MFAAYLLFAAMMSGADPFAAITVYDGAWTMNGTKNMGGLGQPDLLVNHCTMLRAYYTCEQVVNGKSAALIVFTATEELGKFHTQAVLVNGFSTGRGDLTIAGDHWTYQSKDTEGDKTTYYRTENYFTGRDRIHFEQYRSTDGKTWEKQSEGDEVRTKVP